MIPTQSTQRPITLAALEARALEAHRDGTNWCQFWPTVAADARKLAERSPNAARPIYGNLLAIVVSGDTDGMEPPGSCEWEQDGLVADIKSGGPAAENGFSPGRLGPMSKSVADNVAF